MDNDKYRELQTTELKNKYFHDLPRVKKQPSFYNRSIIQSSSSALHDQDQREPYQAVSLQCPINSKRQSVPVRTIICKHVETFDLYNFLDTFSFESLLILLPGAPHSCPICPCQGALYIDTFISSALTLFTPEVLSAKISRDGLLRHPSPSCGDDRILDLATSAINGTSSSPPPDEVDDVFCLAEESSKALNKASGSGYSRRTFSFEDRCTIFGGGLGVVIFSRRSTVDLCSPC